MSRMADLYIDISNKLEKENKGFAAMVDCGCESCEGQTAKAIDQEFQSMSDAQLSKLARA